ncbi:MAG: ABC transporter ATP-binding protein [Candidatus Bathyarchaeia archaeon]
MLELHEVSASYGKLQILWGISFEIGRGEFVTLIGPNGAGKTTTLKTISGILHPTSGTISFLGRAINHLPPHKIIENGLAHVPEGKRIFPYMTVYENLLMGAYTKDARGKISDSLDYVFKIFPILSERKNQLAGTLSGGERQMLAIGMGLMSRPKLIMLDEPSQGLAPLISSKLFDVLKDLNEREGLTILLVEQNVHYALDYSDRGYVIEQGKIMLSGTSEELRNNEHVKKAYLGL